MYDILTHLMKAIFPCPPAEVAATQNISLTKDQLFGPNLSLARNDASTIDLNVDGLREIAAEYIGHQGYTPM